jgi:hypothetical protein
LSAATTFDPIKPAPPVTSNITSPALIALGQLCPTRKRQATWVVGHVKTAGAFDLPTGSGYRRNRFNGAIRHLKNEY